MASSWAQGPGPPGAARPLPLLLLVPLLSLLGGAGERCVWFLVFIVFPLGTQGFRSEYEDYPSEIARPEI